MVRDEKYMKIYVGDKYLRYWTLDKKKKLPSCALGTAMWNATVYHLGTIAFGSLIISIIRMLRTILEYVERKCKMYSNDLTKYADHSDHIL